MPFVINSNLIQNYVLNMKYILNIIPLMCSKLFADSCFCFESFWNYPSNDSIQRKNKA